MNDGVIDSNISGNNSLSITSDIRGYLAEAAKWGYFLSIVGFVGLVIMVVVGIFSATMMGSALSSMPPDMMPVGAGLMSGTFFMIFYIVLAALNFFPVLFLYRYSKKMKVALANNDQLFLAESFKNLKSLFKFLGILTAVFLVIYFLIIIGGILFGVIASM